MALDPASKARFNLERASVLLLDETEIGMSILVQVVTGLGAKRLYRCASLDDAKRAANENQLDLAVVDAMAPTGGGYDFVKWLRTAQPEPNCYTPVMLTTAHTPPGDVGKARDCGGHIMVKKPIAPAVMLERIVWMARAKRPFVFAGDYSGPDRRFRDDPAGAAAARREDDILVAETRRKAVR
jgi:DNA-binding response OmpR family regulator